MLRAFTIRVLGGVQRVGYRRYVLELAQELGVSGYVENMPDGSVAVFAQADGETLEQFIDQLKSPPPPAEVRQVIQKPAKPNHRIRYFTIKYGKLGEELQEGFGAMEKVFRQYWREFRDYREEFRDYREEFREFAKRTDENFQRIMDRYGEISDKLTNILEVLVRESNETREKLNETMRLLREAVERLPQKG